MAPRVAVRWVVVGAFRVLLGTAFDTGPALAAALALGQRRRVAPDASGVG